MFHSKPLLPKLRSAKSLCSSTWPSYLCFVDQTKPPSFAAQTGRLDFSKGFLGTEEPTAQKDAWNKSRSNLPSALHRAVFFFYYLFRCPVAMFRYFSGSTFQCSASPVVEDKSPLLTFSCPRRFGERLTPAVSYWRCGGGTDSPASRSAQWMSLCWSFTGAPPSPPYSQRSYRDSILRERERERERERDLDASLRRTSAGV